MKTTRFTMTVSAILAGVVLLFVVVTKANASTFSESFQVNGQKSSCVRTESTAGTVKKTSITGNCGLLAGQSLTGVTLLTDLMTGGTATVQGTVTSQGSFQVSYGDFAMKSYTLRFTITKGATKLTYTSPTWVFGKQ
jgi:hypothetical protein